MKLTEFREYSNSIVDSFSKVAKKNKVIAFIFTIIIGIIFACPIVCILINLFIQFLGVKFVVIGLITFCGILLHLLISSLYPVYYISLNALDTNIDVELSYKKLFVVSILDLFQIIFIIIAITLMNILVVYMLF